MENSRLQELFDTFDSWTPERQQELINLVHERWIERNAIDFTDEDLDEQFEGIDDGESE